jgi:hypothetical protein
MTAIALATLLAAFAVGAVAAMMRGWGTPIATINVVNNSGKSFGAIELEVETCARRTVLIEASPPQLTGLTYRVPVCGEGGYKVKVTFTDGTTISSVGRYIENGYRTTETVNRDAISSKVVAIVL